MRWQREAVERLVDPLPLRETLKEQLREELWGHLALLYEEERAGGASPVQARLNACQRLGEASHFGASGTVGASLESRLVSWLCAGDGRVVPLLMAFGQASLAVLLLALASTGLPGMDLGAALITWTTTSMLLAFPAIASLLARREARAARPWMTSAAAWRTLSIMFARRLIACAVFGVAAALLVWLAGYALSEAFCVALDRADLMGVVQVFGRDVLLRASLVLPLGAALGWLITWRELQARALPDWPYLDSPRGEA